MCNPLKYGSRVLIQNKTARKNFQLFPKGPIKTVNTNICALPGLSPSISLTFRRSSGSCKPRFLSGRSCVSLTAGERLHVPVCAGGRATVLLASSYGKEGVLRVKVSACLWQQVITLQLACCTLGAVELKWLYLAPVLFFCHINDPCQRGCAGERVSLAARASQSLLNKPPTSRMVSLLRGKPSVALPSLCCLVLAREFCLRNALLYPVLRNRGCSLPIFGISANLSLLIVICSGKYQGKPPFSVTLNKGELAKPEEQTGLFYTTSSVTISLFFFFLLQTILCYWKEGRTN